MYLVNKTIKSIEQMCISDLFFFFMNAITYRDIHILVLINNGLIIIQIIQKNPHILIMHVFESYKQELLFKILFN